MPHKPLRVVVQEQASLIAALRAANQEKDRHIKALTKENGERKEAFKTLEYALFMLEQMKPSLGYTQDGMRLQ